VKRQTTTTQSPTQDEAVRAHGIGVKIDPVPTPGPMATFVAYQRQELIDAHAEELEGWRRHASGLGDRIREIKKREDMLWLAVFGLALLVGYFAIDGLLRCK
jgi:hypothetical protein